MARRVPGTYINIINDNNNIINMDIIETPYTKELLINRRK